MGSGQQQQQKSYELAVTNGATFMSRPELGCDCDSQYS